jgi:hypothetical protein
MCSSTQRECTEPQDWLPLTPSTNSSTLPLTSAEESGCGTQTPGSHTSPNQILTGQNLKAALKDTLDLDDDNESLNIGRY